VKNAGLGKIRFHDLRHTYGSLKIAQGEDPLYVYRQMGHSSINITVDIYGQLLRETNPEAAAKTDALIFGKVSTAC
jgi:integrase